MPTSSALSALRLLRLFLAIGTTAAFRLPALSSAGTPRNAHSLVAVESWYDSGQRLPSQEAAAVAVASSGDSDYMAEQKASQPKYDEPPTCHNKGSREGKECKCDECYYGRQCSVYKYSGMWKPQTRSYHAIGGPSGSAPGDAPRWPLAAVGGAGC